MSGLVVGILVIAVVVLYAVGFHADVVAWRQARRERAVTAELDAAARSVEREYHRTRRAMNEAAGQSWRNLADGDRGGS